MLENTLNAVWLLCCNVFISMKFHNAVTKKTKTIYVHSKLIFFPSEASSLSSALVFKCQDRSFVKQTYQHSCKEINFLPHLRMRCRSAGADRLWGHHGRWADSENGGCGQKSHQVQWGGMVGGGAEGQKGHLPFQLYHGGASLFDRWQPERTTKHKETYESALFFKEFYSKMPKLFCCLTIIILVIRIWQTGTGI